MFTFLISILVAAVSDKPFYSLIHIEQDTKCAEEDIVNSIAQYKASSVWRSQGGSTFVDGAHQRYVDVRDMQSLVGTNRQTTSQNSDAPQNFGSMASRSNMNSRLLVVSEHQSNSNNSGNPNDIRCFTLPTHQQVAPIQVGDPRKHQGLGGKKDSPNITGDDSNRITALEDLNRATLQRSTRAET